MPGGGHTMQGEAILSKSGNGRHIACGHAPQVVRGRKHCKLLASLYKHGKTLRHLIVKQKSGLISDNLCSNRS